MCKAKGSSGGRIPASGQGSARKAAQVRGLTAGLQQGDLGEVAFVHKAMSLGLVVAKPYGHIHRYDFIVDGGAGLWRVQVKTCARMWHGLHQVSISRSKEGVVVPYAASEVDFVVVYIMLEQTWYVLPVREVVGRTSLQFRPEGFSRLDPYAHYREAWHLLFDPMKSSANELDRQGL